MEAALDVDHKSPEFWKPAAVVADAKAWDVPLNRPTTVNNTREYPPQQIERYLDRSRLDFGILTNGWLWRLVPREHQPQQRRFQTYLECDLAGLLDEWLGAKNWKQQWPLLDEFEQFYLFFNPASYKSTKQLKPLVHRALQGSSEYRVGVGEGLKDRAFKALALCIEGFLNYQANELFSGVHLEQCRAESFIVLYRLLFVMFAEDRRLLPYRINRTYTDNRSLGRHRDEIAGRLDRIRDGEDIEDFSRHSTDIWEDLNSLFDLIDGGHKRYGVPEYNGGLFSADSHPFLNEKRISDFYVARVIDQLGRAPDPINEEADLFRVDYRDLAIQHLGSIYEGLLELQPKYALQDMVVISKRVQGQLEERYHAESEPIPRGWQLTGERCREGHVYLQTERGERRASGSYYTPDEIVDYIVDETIGPLCKRVSDELDREINEVDMQLRAATGSRQRELELRLQQLGCDFDDRILHLKILDPAMGSGHFLIRACQKLAEEIATHPFTGDETTSGIREGESAVSYWKRRVVEDCLYGVDVNYLAVELAKLALWLETVASDEPLTFLDHHLHVGNSLVGGTICDLGVLPDEIELRSDEFKEQVELKLPSLTENLARIHDLPSDAATSVREKERIYRFFERLREPFRLVGDLWCSAFCDDSDITSEEYQQAVEELGKPRRFARLQKQAWFADAISAARRQFTRCFHWELEFPEVFFDGPESRVNPGFDAVIGNPPYVNIRLITQQQGEQVKRFLREQYRSAHGLFDLYVLFVERPYQLLRDGGRWGMIVPNKIATLDYAEKCRELLLNDTSIEVIADVSGLNVFPGVGVYPYVIIWEKRSPSVDHRVSVVTPIRPDDLLDAKPTTELLQTDFSADSGLMIHGTLDVESRVPTVRFSEIATLHSGTTGFAAQQMAEALTERATCETEHFDFIVSGNIDRYAVRLGQVRFMKRDFLEPVLERGHDILTANKRNLFAGPKLVVAGMTRRLEAAYDPGGLSLGVQVYAAAEPSVDPWYLLGILNSKLISYVFAIRFQAKHLAGDYLSINKGQLAKLPIREVDMTKAGEKKLYDRVVGLVKRISPFAQAVAAAETADDQRTAQRKMVEIDAQIDATVYELYKLRPAEIEAVEQEVPVA